jgi:ATP-dependent DNA helicase RecG
MTHPEVRFLAAGEEPHAEYLPIYPLAESVRQSDVRLAVQAAIKHVGESPEEAFPPNWLERKSLMPIGESLREVHFPTSLERMAQARRRLIYQELLLLQLGLRMHRREQRERGAAPVIAVDARLDSRIRARFPFEFTASQRQAVAEITADIAMACPMNRLLQGDVGSGKTAVAIYAMLAAVAAGRQAAIMAPTELLARQHMASLERLLAGSKIGLELLVGGQSAAKREKALARIGLVVIDEQHRFGVIQRSQLQQGNVDPHVLVMTATPIPRTIALAIHGDLDQSVMKTGPAGRQPVRTYRVSPGDEERWWEHFRKKLREGRQGYVVVPAVDESSRGLASVSTALESLANGPLEAFRLGLVHGRLKSKEKQAVMESFRGGNLDVLVCTSVIEVGIDVPNATLMTILDAESFGLAQLHQLRGRVARGPVAGICGAFASSATEPHPRIDAFAGSSDGFVLAELDLALRGPGELVGTRQSGRCNLYLADLREHPEFIEEAREDAIALLERDPMLSLSSHQRLQKLVIDRWGETIGLGNVG